MNTSVLIHESSPYLLQHAHNPVNWLPWGEAAFEKARSENKPVFLSVGYSTCHWCHVMERESFENEAIASLLNRHFVPVKVAIRCCETPRTALPPGGRRTSLLCRSAVLGFVDDWKFASRRPFRPARVVPAHVRVPQ